MLTKIIRSCQYQKSVNDKHLRYFKKYQKNIC